MQKFWQSKKFWALVVGIAGVVLPAVLKDVKWAQEADSVWKMVVAYLIAQGYVDAQALKTGGA